MATPIAWAQTETGQLLGSVTNRGGKAIAAASIQVSDIHTGVSRDSTSSPTGSYDVPSLVPGSYTVAVSAPGFETATATVVIAAGAAVRLEFFLQPGDSSPVSSQSAPGLVIDSETQTLRRIVTEAEMQDLPNLTRDPVRLAELAGNSSDAGLGTRGVGLAINGQRESSTTILLDGVDNKDEFTGSAGQSVPLDSIREFSLFTSDFTAEYGRASGGILTAAGQRGSSQWHATGYEFNRVTALTTNSFEDNANGTREPVFARNQFGVAVGGALIRNKLFIFENTEITLVRSESTNYAWVVTPQLLSRTAPATQSFFQSLGQLRPGAQIIGTTSLGQLTAMAGLNPCLGLTCASLPSALPLFSHVAYTAPGDSGGGFPQNTGNSYTRLDYNLSSRTQLYGRYQIYDERDQTGVLSNSPYANYDLGQSQFDNSFLISGTHEWNSRWFSQTSLAFDRLNIYQQGLTSRGVVPTMYANPIGPVTIGADSIAFPGYNPFSPGVGGAFGGPENILQLNHDVSWTKGNHLLRFGGTYIYVRDNRTDAAYQTANDSLSNGGGIGPTLIGLLYGTFAQIQVAVNPQGQLPCGQNPTCALNLPVSSPDFTRSDRYQDGALYAQDYWRLKRRIAVNLGVRWDHFGVQHDANPNLDSNWYAPGVGFADSNLIQYMVLGGLFNVTKSSVGGLYRPDWKDFAPRVGVAWDVFGDGKTSLRAGYGIGYDRNFDNVTFNVIQNLPNYAVLNIAGPITSNNFGPLSGSSGTVNLPPPGARIIDPNLKTAFAHFWSASAQRAISRTMTYSLEYSGSKGVDLYSVDYPNQEGFRNSVYGNSCLGVGDCRTSPNPYYNEDVGYRGNQGFSTYYGIDNRFTTNNLFHSGAMLTASYTWSHAVDNISSTFFEAGGTGVANRFGDRNITINNGDFDAGLLDPYNPNLDRGNAEFDIRHRVVVSGVWKLLYGVNIAPLFIARSGQPFSVFDTIAQTLDLSAPRATFTTSVPTSRNTFVATPMADVYQLFTFQPSSIAHEPNNMTPGSQFPANMSQRDAFRAPGFWNFDLAVRKDTKLTERLDLQLRAELFNVFNHANLYVIGASANTGAGNTVDACFGCSGSSWDRRQIQLGARVSF